MKRAFHFHTATLPKPIELKFNRGNDGGAYVVFVPTDPIYDRFQVGDKIEAVSASFGDEIWGAESYGQVMYAIKNRNGDIYLKMTDMDGDFKRYNKVYAEYFAGEGNPNPTRTTIEINCLPTPIAVEVKVVAYTG